MFLSKRYEQGEGIMVAVYNIHYFLYKRAKKIDRKAQVARSFWTALVPLVVMFVFMEYVIAPLIPPPGVPDNWQHWFSGQMVSDFIGLHPESLTHLVMGGILDCLMPLAYVRGFSFLVSVTFSASFLESEHELRQLNLLPYFVAVFDEIENAGLLLAYQAYPTVHWGGDVAGYATMIKWFLIFVMVGVIMIGLIARVVRRMQGKSPYCVY